MAAYVIADIEVTDPEGYQEYTSQSRGTIEQYGGRFVVRGGTYETIEGDWDLHRIVITEFPTLEQAKRWYQSPEYQAILPIRQANSRTHFMTFVDGV